MHFDTLKDWLDWQENLHPQSIDLGLSRVRQVFNALQDDSSCTKPVTITVAGTNGKGSSVAFLEAIYLAQGLRVGAYTSPHIINYNERIKINAQPVSDSLICAAFARIEAVRNNISLSYFEFSTLAALDIFSQSGLDIQLLEVGLGGRLDAVNLINPDAAIVTSISIDHTAWLGETREAIAYEKAGVFRAATPAITGELDPPQSLIESANEKQALLLRLGQEFNYSKNQNSWNWYSKQSHLSDLPAPVLKGEHQYRNASSVLVAIDYLQDKIAVSEQAIRQGLKQANLPGRFQLITSEPAVLLDVSHNPQAAQALIDHLQTEYKQTPVHAIFTMMNDKDISGVVNLMQPYITHWYISPLDNVRTINETELEKTFQQYHINKISLGYTNFLACYQDAKNKALNDQGIILIFGSFFLVSEYLTLFSEPQGQ